MKTLIILMLVVSLGACKKSETSGPSQNNPPPNNPEPEPPKPPVQPDPPEPPNLRYSQTRQKLTPSPVGRKPIKVEIGSNLL